MNIETDKMTPELFLRLYTSVGWEPPCAEQAAAALSNSFAKLVAFDGDKAVGMLRVIGDGGMSFYIKDFAVIPEYQSKGVGGKLLAYAEEYIRSHIGSSWAVSLELISSKEAVNFYEKHGFEQRPCSWDGPGMFKMLR
ncbi:MAG: GNAT family N-acetyltransferase [Ruminiclostridium sp.]